MEINVCNGGWIEAICGPMFSGKTEELIRRLRRARIAGTQVAIFKPVFDGRYSDSELVSHANARLHSTSISSATEILNRLGEAIEVVGIDEANFFGPELVGVAARLANGGKRVIVAGLDLDYLGRPFQPMPELLAIAESITKLLAICVRCGSAANYTQRTVHSSELILVGSVDSYEARCRRCFEPGVPRQNSLDLVLADPDDPVLH